MRQAVITSPTKFEVVTASPPKRKSEGELILQTAACGICSGDLMEWYLQKKVGTVFGHEPVGVAVDVGSQLDHIRPGELVFVHHHAPCMTCRYCRLGQYVQCATWKKSHLDPGGMAEFIRVPEVNAREDCFAIPDLTPEVGLFIEPLACSVKCLSLIDPSRADLGIVIGCGVMGLLNIAAAKGMGTREVWGVEPDPARQKKASRMGASRVLEPSELEEESARGKFEGADYVIVGPGSPRVIEHAVQFVRPGGSLLLFTPTPTGEKTPLDLADVYFREIRILPSYSCGPTDTRRAYELLRTGKVDPRPTITHRFPLEQVQEAYNVAKGGGVAIKVIVTFDKKAE